MGRGTLSAAAMCCPPVARGNLNFAINGGGSGNKISAGPGNLNAGFNFFGGTNAVAAGPGPLAFAGSIFRNGPLIPAITQTGPGIAINGNPIGGTAATSSQSSTVPSTQRNLSRPSLNFTPGLNSTSNLSSTSSGGPIVKSNNQLAASAKKFNDRLAASAKKFNDRLAASAKKFNDRLAASAKKFNDRLAASAKKPSDGVTATGGAAKADADSSSDGDGDSGK